jgi:NADH dehydrogenase
LTRNQVELMQIDNVASPKLPGFAELGIAPTGIEAILARGSNERGRICT